MSLRHTREEHTFNNRVLNLEDVKNRLLMDTDAKKVELTFYYFMNHPSLSSRYEKYTAYLHYLIMFSTPKNVNSFLDEHYMSYGQYATQLFINYPFPSSIDRNVITPLMCAAMWCNNPEMARVLYSWGADFTATDLNGKYPEEKYGSYYVNHLNHLLGFSYFIIGLRSVKDFIPIIEEIRFLAGEKRPPPDWKPPDNAYSKKNELLAKTVTQETRANESNHHA